MRLNERAKQIEQEVASDRKFLDYTEVLARLFEDPTIDETGSKGMQAAIRLKTILDATADSGAGGLTHFSGPFKDWHDMGFRLKFQDPWWDSNNQVGHFMTAVDLGFRPEEAVSILIDSVLPHFNIAIPFDLPFSVRWARRKKRRTRDEWERGSPVLKNVSPEWLCKRLIIGHEKGFLGDWAGCFPEQFLETTPEDIRNFNVAQTALGPFFRLDVESAEPFIKRIPVRTAYPGCSYQDLELSLVGWVFGQNIASGNIVTSRDEAAEWVRWNLSEKANPSDIKP